MVRDPRDLILSAARYHTRSDEQWLHRPSDKFGGKTYSEAINALENFKDQLSFEMDNSSGQQIMTMANFEFDSTIEMVKYEDLIQDYETTFFGGLLDRLGFSDDEEIKVGREVFWENALFGGLKENKPSHFTNGAVAQWETQFTDVMLERFNERFAEPTRALGYTV